jgi:hypothetical protein
MHPVGEQDIEAVGGQVVREERADLRVVFDEEEAGLRVVRHTLKR